MNLGIRKTRLVGAIFFSVFWIMAVYPFIIQQSISYDFFMSIRSYIDLIIDFFVIVLGLTLLRNRSDIIIFGSFIILTAISTIFVNGLSVAYWINGMRYYAALLFMRPIFNYYFRNPKRKKKFIYRMDRILYFFLWLQVPCMIYQCALYGAFDRVGGSIGQMMSGLITSLIYMISFYLMLRRWNHNLSYIQNILKNWILIFLLFPSFLNETKVAFVFIFLYFFFLIPIDRKFIIRLIVISPLIVLILLGCGYLYLYFVDTRGDNVFSIEYIEEYIMGNDGTMDYVEYLVDEGIEEFEDESDDLFRGAKFAAIPMVFNGDIKALMLGMGVGQFKGGNSMEKTKFAKEFGWLTVGTTMMGMVWFIDMGWMGIIWLLCVFSVLFGFFRKCHRNYQLQAFLVLTLILESVYVAAFMHLLFSIIFIYLGYISCRWDDVEEVPLIRSNDK